jgi:hypothetical protein
MNSSFFFMERFFQILQQRAFYIPFECRSRDDSGTRRRDSCGQIILCVCEAVHILPTRKEPSGSLQEVIDYGGRRHAHDCHLSNRVIGGRAYDLVNVDAAQTQRHGGDKSGRFIAKAAHGNIEIKSRLLDSEYMDCPLRWLPPWAGLDSQSLQSRISEDFCRAV